MDAIPSYLFDKRDYKLLSIVRDIHGGRLGAFHSQGELYALFHPEGIKELAESRGMRIAYATLLLLSSLAAGRVEDRLAALRALRDEVIETASGSMPKNAARVLLQIMKELVRAAESTRRQLELAHDFRSVTSGKPRVIRRQLKKYHLLEMPEAWNQVSFDDHVHDANTKGRKTPTHLIMDAWIKGIRRLRVIYYNHIGPQSAMELMQAAAILGITLRIGIEFSARFRGKYVRLIWVPRGFADHQAFLCFLTESKVQTLMEAGRQVSKYQERHVLSIFEAFNRQGRFTLKERYGVGLPELDEKELRAYVAPGQLSLLHLSKYIDSRIKSLLPEVMADLRKAYAGELDEDERAAIREKAERLNRINSETILEEFLAKTKIPKKLDPSIPNEDPSAPELLKLSPAEVVDRLTALHSAHRITLNLSNLTVEDVLEILYECEGKITRLEIFNLKDFAAGITGHIPPIIELQQAVNQGNAVALKRMIRRVIGDLGARSPIDQDRIDRLKVILHDIVSMKAFYSDSRLKSRVGSDSSGASHRSHGMGLVVEETLPWRARRQIRNSRDDRLRLPISLCVAPRIDYIMPSANNLFTRTAFLVRWLPGCGMAGMERVLKWEVLETVTRLTPKGNIVTLGGTLGPTDNGLSLEGEISREKEKTPLWPNMNNLIKNGIKILVGFVPAFATFALTKDWWVLAYGGAFIWFGITGLRNVLQSILGGGGLRRSPLLHWNDLVSWERISDSLLFTGFSVPLLDYFIKTLVLDKGFGIDTSTHPVWLYSFIALANGAYVTSHNLFRGLPRGAAAVNFFRSILSIPLAVVMNWGIDGGLRAFGIGPTAPVLQKWAAIISKTASDVVAGIIEGTVDRFQNIDRRRMAIKLKFNQILNDYAMLEMLLPETKTLGFLLGQENRASRVPADARDLAKNMYVHALDLLYFWMYQPRSRIAMRNILGTMSPDERRIILETQMVLKQQRPVSLLFIEGVLGQGFSKPLAFYLSHCQMYLAAVERMLEEVAGDGE